VSDKSRKKWESWQEILSKSKSPSKANINWELLGIQPTDGEGLFENNLEHVLRFYIVLDRAWRNPFSLKGRFAREGALHVAICASEGFITNKISEDVWGKEWTITPEGIAFKEGLDNVLKDSCGDFEHDTNTLH